jgi:hypothetical protein
LPQNILFPTTKVGTPNAPGGSFVQLRRSQLTHVPVPRQARCLCSAEALFLVDRRQTLREDSVEHVPAVRAHRAELVSRRARAGEQPWVELDGVPEFFVGDAVVLGLTLSVGSPNRTVPRRARLQMGCGRAAHTGPRCRVGARSISHPISRSSFSIWVETR